MGEPGHRPRGFSLLIKIMMKRHGFAEALFDDVDPAPRITWLCL